MRIAILGSRGYPYVYSGYETFVAELAPRLVKRGHEVVVYCHSELFDKKPESVSGIRLVYVPGLKNKTLSQLTHSLFSSIHAGLSDADGVLVLNSANGPFGALLRLLGKYTAINVDGVEWLRPKWRGLGAKYFRVASRLATRFYHVVITDSSEMARIYTDEFGCRSETIAYGNDVEHSENPEILYEFGLRPGDYYLIVGRLIPDNNSDIIIEGFRRSTSTRKLVVVGDVPYRDAFAERVKSFADDRVIFTGYIRDKTVLQEFYCNAYVYIHGHEFGGTNPTLLKALGSGCCILALDTPFSREVLDSDTHGFYFTKDASSVSSMIEQLDGHPSNVYEMARKARERLGLQYSWDHVTDEYERVFRRLCARGRGYWQGGHQ